MITKSFRQQLQHLYSLSAYKATGMFLPCHCIPFIQKETNNSKLTFKVDIAHQLYNKYKQQNFKFSDKGVTPRLLAEQTAIYCHESEELNLEIDSFGNMLVTPTYHYYKQMLKNIAQGQFLRHSQINIKGLNQQKQEKIDVFYAFDDLSLSSLRIVFNLELICRKKVLMQEIDVSQVNKLIDLTSLKENELTLLQKSELINIKDFDVQLSYNAPENIGMLFDSSNIKINSSFSMFNMKNLLSGCLRHNYISFLVKYKIPDSSNILKFGQILPNIELSKIQQIYKYDYKQKLKQLMKKSIQINHKIPFKLDQSLNHTIIPDKILQQCSRQQELLMILDMLGRDQINETLVYVKSLNQKERDKRPWIKILQKTIDRLL